MQSPFIHQGTVPSGDGTVTRYVSAEVVGKAWYSPAKPVIYVNGMQNSGQDHYDSAQALSLMVGAPVYGVFNKSAATRAAGWCRSAAGPRCASPRSTPAPACAR